MEMGGDYSALGILRAKLDLRRKAQGLERIFHLTIRTEFIEEMDGRREGKLIEFEILTVATSF